VTKVARRPRPAPAAAPAQRRPSWGAIADAIGCCVLAFAFLPPLASLVRWLTFESANALNLSDHIVLEFLPIRGAITLVAAFLAGVVPGVIAGLIDGALVSVWWTWRGVPTRGHALLLGAACGVLAAALMIVVILAVQVATTSTELPTASSLAFEVGSGLACGIVSAPGAVRLLAAPARLDPAPAVASARPR
jgi:hypothetical protein